MPVLLASVAFNGHNWVALVVEVELELDLKLDLKLELKVKVKVKDSK